MAVEAFEGVVENGQIRLEGNVTLPDHTKVYVIVSEERSAPFRVYSPHLVHRERMADFVKEVIEIAPDDGV